MIMCSLLPHINPMALTYRLIMENCGIFCISLLIRSSNKCNTNINILKYTCYKYLIPNEDLNNLWLNIDQIKLRVLETMKNIVAKGIVH